MKALRALFGGPLPLAWFAVFWAVLILLGCAHPCTEQFPWLVCVVDDP